LTQSQTSSDETRLNYGIDNKNKRVSLDFQTIYKFGNYFIQYEYFKRSNVELNSILSQKYFNDSLSNVYYNSSFSKFNNIYKNDSIEKSNLKQIVKRNEDSLNSKERKIVILENTASNTKQFIIPFEKKKSKIGGIVLGGSLGLSIGTLIGMAIIKLSK